MEVANSVTFIKSKKKGYLVNSQPELDFFDEANWQILNEITKIDNIDCQKATRNYGGRVWSAWFTKEIPIQDGPYKFKNLPGLILKVEDSNKNHVFELKGIKNGATEFEYPKLNNYKEYKLG